VTSIPYVLGFLTYIPKVGTSVFISFLNLTNLLKFIKLFYSSYFFSNSFMTSCWLVSLVLLQYVRLCNLKCYLIPIYSSLKSILFKLIRLICDYFHLRNMCNNVIHLEINICDDSDGKTQPVAAWELSWLWLRQVGWIRCRQSRETLRRWFFRWFFPLIEGRGKVW